MYMYERKNGINVPIILWLLSVNISFFTTILLQYFIDINLYTLIEAHPQANMCVQKKTKF